MDEHQRALKAKFTSADANSDGSLDSVEFGAFVHPQRHEHMVQHLVQDQLSTYDKDNDGIITRKEYMGRWGINVKYTSLIKDPLRTLSIKDVLQSFQPKIYKGGMSDLCVLYLEAPLIGCGGRWEVWDTMQE